ncbi:MAG: tetratricopeptide repeat protein [Chitinispirillaceae bacterium]|nr:tetratricopeptide repeat protein [Chitinispirillaceae bacterium]
MLKVLTVVSIIIFLSVSCFWDSQRSIEKGESSLRLGDYSMAITFFREVLIADPENYRARLGMGKALIQMSSAHHSDTLLWYDAITHLEAARTIHPESEIEPLLSDAWTVQARIKLGKNDTIGALSALSRAIDYNPRSLESLNLAGIIYYRIGEPSKSRVLFERALMVDTLKAFTHFNMGMLYWAQNDIEGAHRSWLKAITLAPDDKDIVYWYSVAEQKIKE